MWCTGKQKDRGKKSGESFDYEGVDLTGPQEVFKSIFDMAATRLDAQRESLDELRARSTAAVTAMGSFLAVLAAVTITRHFDTLAVVATILSSITFILFLVVLYPRGGWVFVPRRSADLLNEYANNKDNAVNYFYTYSVRDMKQCWEDNASRITSVMNCLSVALLASVFSLLFWVIAFSAH